MTWVVLLVVLDLWVTYVLRQFAYTRPGASAPPSGCWAWPEQFAPGVAEAVPGLLTAALIFFLARLVVRASTALLQRIERGDLEAHAGSTATPPARPAASATS